jgi:hypothetical protein
MVTTDELVDRIKSLEEQVGKINKDKPSKDVTTKRPKRAPTAYNIFIGNYLKKHHGEKDHKQLFSDATAAWQTQGTKS